VNGWFDAALRQQAKHHITEFSIADRGLAMRR
jgi:hypothetical protein